MPTNQADLTSAIYNYLIQVDPADIAPTQVFELEAPPNTQGNYVIFRFVEDDADINFYDQAHDVKALLEVKLYVPKFAFNPLNPNGGTQALRRLGDIFYANLAYQSIANVPGYSQVKINPLRRGTPEVEADRLWLTQRYLVSSSSQYD